MYSLDPNINAAVERQADRVRAVNAYCSRHYDDQSATAAAPASRWASSVAGKAVLAIAAAPILAVVAWVLLAR